ncbi:MAG: hypothetical protein L0Z70_12465 [Chloroflexi bacterium]|nr:hypothetical protein [Chloroflexota bacterium]
MALALLAGCSNPPASPPVEPAAAIQAEEANAAGAVQATSEPQATHAQGLATATTGATPEDTVPPEVIATPRPGMEATDPATVNLASGEVQFIEFFAFW